MPPLLEGSGGNRSRPSIRSSAQSAAEEIKFSAGDLFPFSCQRSTASGPLTRSRASGDPAAVTDAADGRTTDAACLPARPAVPLLITRKPITPIRERKTFHLNSDCLSP